jgi:hypothetical protein
MDKTRCTGIHIDNNGSAVEDLTFQFHKEHHMKSTALDISTSSRRRVSRCCGQLNVPTSTSTGNRESSWFVVIALGHGSDPEQEHWWQHHL